MKDFFLAKRIYTKSSINKLNKKIKLLGSDNKLSTISFLNFRLITSILIFILSLFIFRNYGYLLAPLLTILYYFLIYYFCIDYRIKKRTNVIENDAVTFFEVLTLAVESGNDLRQAIIITSNSINSDLSNEFKIAVNEMNYSKTLNESVEYHQIVLII